MPSPFPGMDPFLEHSAFFPDLHDSLITYVREWLQSQLPAPYFCMIGSRVWTEISRYPIEPDIYILKDKGVLQGTKGMQANTPIAHLPRTKPIAITVPHDKYRETRVEVHARLGDSDRLVTVVEMLSPFNKTAGARGRDLYINMQQEILASPVNLVEIDLLRGGEPTTAVLHDLAQERAGPFDYHVCFKRFHRCEDFFVYPILLTEPLPEIAIPLLLDDADVPLDLQAVFNRAYDTGPYSRRVRYQEELLTPPLRPDLAEWLRQVLAANKG